MRYPGFGSCCHLCGEPALDRLVIRGLMAKERDTGFSNTREGNRGTLLCPFCSASPHDALCEVSGQLQEGELLFAYLDDVYVVSKPDRTRFLYDVLANKQVACIGRNRTPRGQNARGTKQENARLEWLPLEMTSGALMA